MEDIKSVSLTGNVDGFIDCTSKKGRNFEVEVSTKDTSRYLLAVSDTHMYIINRAIEYVGAFTGMEVRVNFEAKTMEIFVIKGLSIVISFNSATCVRKGAA